MIETRPIRPAEADDFLRLLCKVFNLDFDRARGIFYHEPLYDLDRKWALFEHGRMVSILTTVPLEFGWGRAYGIAGVGTEPDAQRHGHAARLLQAVWEAAGHAGEQTAFLFARDPRLYRRLGFEILDETIEAPINGREREDTLTMLGADDVRLLYDHWAEADANRLRRDAKRWSYWGWNMRMCHRAGAGYLCIEGDMVREGIGLDPKDWSWRIPLKWSGLKSMAERCGIPIGESTHGMYFMGMGAQRPPEMFLTDQF